MTFTVASISSLICAAVGYWFGRRGYNGVVADLTAVKAELDALKNPSQTA